MITSIKQFKMNENDNRSGWQKWYDNTIAPAKGNITLYIHKIKKLVNDLDNDLLKSKNYTTDILRVKSLLGEILNIDETVTENVKIQNDIIDFDILTKLAHSIYTLDVDYGIVYFNDETNYIAVSLGDSNVFDDVQLENSIKYGVVKNYDDAKHITVEIDAEWVPKNVKYKYTGKGWIEI